MHLCTQKLNMQIHISLCSISCTCIYARCAMNEEVFDTSLFVSVSKKTDIKCFTIPYPNIGCKMKGMLPPSPNKKLKGGLSK